MQLDLSTWTYVTLYNNTPVQQIRFTNNCINWCRLNLGISRRESLEGSWFVVREFYTTISTNSDYLNKNPDIVYYGLLADISAVIISGALGIAFEHESDALAFILLYNCKNTGLIDKRNAWVDDIYTSVKQPFPNLS